MDIRIRPLREHLLHGDATANELVQQLPLALRRLLDFEQKNLWRLDRFRACSHADDAFDPRFLPESSVVFELPYVIIQKKSLYILGGLSEGESVLQNSWLDRCDSEVRFPIHPTQLHEYSEHLGKAHRADPPERDVRLVGTPTSSVRTLLVWRDGLPHSAAFVKLSLRSESLGDRRLSRRQVASSVGLSHFVHNSRSALPTGLQYFAEPVGLVPRRTPQVGAILRTIPEEVVDGSVIPAPLFALMGGTQGHPPLLLQLLRRKHGTARDLLDEMLLATFAKLWIALVFDHGLILEAHGQDLLLAMSPNLEPLGTFYYRDFEGLTVDWALRRARGFLEPTFLPHTFEWFSTYETWGYPRYQMLATKLWVSLTDFLELVLAELEYALLKWQLSATIAPEGIESGVLTRIYSAHLREAIREKFGLIEAADYDIRHQRHRFVKFLMRVRHEILTQ